MSASRTWTRRSRRRLCGGAAAGGPAGGARCGRPGGIPPARVGETGQLRRRVVMSGVLSAPVLLLAMSAPLQFTYWQWLSLMLAAPVVVWGAWPFHQAAWVD